MSSLFLSVLMAQVLVPQTIRVGAGETFDGKGKTYHWTGAGDCSQREGMPPMFVLEEGATLKNVKMRGAPDGVHITGSHVTIDALNNLDVCEDAVSILGPKDETLTDIKIINSRFAHCEDKGLMIPGRGQVRGVLIQRNTFYKCAQSIRVKPAATGVQVLRNRFDQVGSALRVEGSGEHRFSGNRVDTALWGIRVQDGGWVRDSGDNRFETVREIVQIRRDGRILRPGQADPTAHRQGR